MSEDNPIYKPVRILNLDKLSVMNLFPFEGVRPMSVNPVVNINNPTHKWEKNVFHQREEGVAGSKYEGTKIIMLKERVLEENRVLNVSAALPAIVDDKLLAAIASDGAPFKREEETIHKKTSKRDICNELKKYVGLVTIEDTGININNIAHFSEKGIFIAGEPVPLNAYGLWLKQGQYEFRILQQPDQTTLEFCIGYFNDRLMVYSVEVGATTPLGLIQDLVNAANKEGLSVETIYNYVNPHIKLVSRDYVPIH